MQPISSNKPKAFSNRKITVDQAIRILKRNGIRVSEDQARIILDFLYLIAKTLPKSGMVPLEAHQEKSNIKTIDLTIL